MPSFRTTTFRKGAKRQIRQSVQRLSDFTLKRMTPPRPSAKPQGPLRPRPRIPELRLARPRRGEKPSAAPSRTRFVRKRSVGSQLIFRATKFVP